MSMEPKQFGSWRRREQEAISHQGKMRTLPLERIRALMVAVVLGGVAWTGFYWTYGKHQITSLDEFSSYLKGEDLYRKYEISNLTWDCKTLRVQFDAQYLSKTNGRIRRENKTLIFSKKGLDEAGLKTWSAVAVKRLTLKQARKVENDAMLVTAMMVRLFPSFRFQSGKFVRDVKNIFGSKCGK
jgi:hypothetical protein